MPGMRREGYKGAADHWYRRRRTSWGGMPMKSPVLGMLSVAAGVSGVLVIVRPDNGLTDPASLLPLVAAAAYSVSALLARRLGTTESGSAMALSATAVYIVAGAITAAVLTGFDASPTTHDSL